MLKNITVENYKKPSNKNTVNSNEKTNINIIEQKETNLCPNIYNPKILDNKNVGKDLTEFQNKKNSLNNIDNKIILKNLKQKQNTLINDVNSLKRIKKNMNEISYNNITQAKIDNNLYNNKIKKIINLENDLVDKLSEIKRQINDISKSENYSSNKNVLNINLNSNNKFSGKINKVQLLEENDKRLMELQKEYKNKQKELKEFEDNKKNEKLKYLIEQREKEMEIIRKRKQMIDKKMEKIKNESQPTPKKENCLFYKMEQNYQENEKKLLQKISTEKKVKNIYYKQNVDIENINNEFQTFKNQLQQRAIEQTNNMKKVWHSRSMITKKYETNTMLNLKENDEAEVKNDQIMKLTKKGLFLEKELYAKKKVKLPPINEKLKQESIKNQIDIKNFEGKERVKYVNDKYMQKGFKIKNINKDFDYGKKYVFNKKVKKKESQNNNQINQIQIKKIGNLLSSGNNMNKNIYNNLEAKIINIKNIKNNNNMKINNIKNNNDLKMNKLAYSADKIKKVKKNPKEINYLNEFKKEKNKNFHKWNKYIINKDNKGNKEIDMEGLENINKQIEILDEKANLGNELLKLKGGYENNIEYGDKLNNILIDSIHGKLAIINEFYNVQNK